MPYTISNRPFWVSVFDPNRKRGFGCKLVGTVNDLSARIVSCTLKFLTRFFSTYMVLLRHTHLFIFWKSFHLSTLFLCNKYKKIHTYTLLLRQENLLPTRLLGPHAYQKLQRSLLLKNLSRLQIIRCMEITYLNFLMPLKFCAIVFTR